MAELIKVAQRVMDLYYQNYTPNDAFLDIDDFKFHVATTYSTMLNALYQQEKKFNKQMDGFSNIEIPAAWMIIERLPIEYDAECDEFFVKLKWPVFSFDFDSTANALQGVHSVGKKHQLYRKIGLLERRFRQVIPPVGVILFFLNEPTVIKMWDPPPGQLPVAGAQVEVQYVPTVVGMENNCRLSDNIIAPLTEQVLSLLFKAKNGNFIQKADDQNPNTPVPQVDPALGK